MPSINRDIGSFERVALPAAYRIRRKKPFHATEVPCRCAVSLVHVTTTDPLRSGRHSDLIAHAVIANRRPDGMRAVANVVARKRRIIAAGISNAVVDGIVPVVIVIGRDSVPAPVVRLQRVVRPTLTSICAADRNSLARESQCPHIRCVGVTNVRFNRRRLLRLARAANKRSRLKQRNSECAGCLRFAPRLAG